MVSTDIVTYFNNKWDNANTSGVTPKIAYEIDEDELEDGEADVPLNWNRAVFFRIKTDFSDEIGLQRTHQNEGSEDIYICTAIDFSLLECRKLLLEIRRVCLLNLTDDKHSWLDFAIAVPTGPKHRNQHIFAVMFSKAGIGF